MQRIIHICIYTLLMITWITAVVTILGLLKLWMDPDATDLPYLGWLVTAVILEAVGMIFVITKKGLKYFPKVHHNKSEEDTIQFMNKFISSGTSAIIVSNRASWMDTREFLEILHARCKKDVLFKIITAQDLPDSLKAKLPSNNIEYYVTKLLPPESRFTLLNSNRTGAERLAIARGTHPDHEISVFDSNSGPQVIAMAKDIVRYATELSTNA